MKRSVPMVWACALGLLLSLAVPLVGLAAGLEAPALKGRVNDYAGMLSPGTESRLEAVLKELEDRDSTQVVLSPVPEWGFAGRILLAGGRALEDRPERA